MRIGLIGIDSSHADDFLRHFNAEGRHPGTAITTVWHEDAARVAELQSSYPELRRSRSIAELVTEVEAVIIGGRDGASHRAGALPALAAGLPVFVDKPFANSVADAEAMVAAAARSGAPLLSGSALRWQPETARLKATLEGGDPTAGLRVWGTWFPDSSHGGPIFYAIHAIEMAQELAGTAWHDLERVAETTFDYMAAGRRVTLEFRPPRQDGASEFGVAVQQGRGVLELPIVLGDDYMLPVVDRIAAMLGTGSPGLGRRELLAPVEMMGELEGLLEG